MTRPCGIFLLMPQAKNPEQKPALFSTISASRAIIINSRILHCSCQALAHSRKPEYFDVTKIKHEPALIDYLFWLITRFDNSYWLIDIVNNRKWNSFINTKKPSKNYACFVLRRFRLFLIHLQSKNKATLGNASNSKPKDSVTQEVTVWRKRRLLVAPLKNNDIFCTFDSKEQIDQFFDNLNKAHSNVSFSKEVEADGQLAYFDVLLTKTETGIE